jgi:hypothetical protein
MCQGSCWRPKTSTKACDHVVPAVKRAGLALNRVNMVMYPIDVHGVEIDVRTATDQQ